MRLQWVFQKILFLALWVTMLLPLALGAEESNGKEEEKKFLFSSKGEIGGEARAFYPDNDFRTEDYGLGLAGRLEVGVIRRPLTTRARIFSRVDGFDRHRARIFLEELWLDFSKGDLQLRVGSQLINWTATEAFHPADVLNSRNFDSTRIENAEKIGEPIASLSYKFFQGSMTGYFMPALISPIFPSGKSRLNFAPTGIKLGNSLFFEQDGFQSDDHFTPQWAATVSQSFGATDILLQFIQHVDRSQPLIAFDSLRNEFRPAFLFVSQWGGTAVHVVGPVVLKLEGAYRSFKDPGATPWGYLDQKDHGQIAGGIEYGWAHQNGSETSFILEAQSIIRKNKQEREALSLFQNDVLAGVRYAFNDEMSREILATAIVDVERSQEMLFNVTYQQRLTDTWKVEGGFRIVHAPQKNFSKVGLESLDRADQLFLSLIRYF